MDPKDKKEEIVEPEKTSQEPQFDFEEAKDLTVGQVIRKNEEIEAGVTPDDTILDKYIKQHREEIEADKFANIQAKKEELQSLDDLLQEAKETIEEDAEPVEEVSEPENLGEEEGIESQEFILPPLEETLDMDKNLGGDVTEPLSAEADEATQEELQSLSRSSQAEDEPQNKKVWFILSAVVAVIIHIL